MEVLNYTVYSTEDLLTLYEAVKAELGPAHPKDRRRRGDPPKKLAVVYWQGQRRQPSLYVRPDCAVDPERGCPTLRIRKPDKLSSNPLELLALSSDHPCIPQEAVEQVAGAFSHLIRGWRTPLPKEYRIRINEMPELMEDSDQRKARVAAKKVRKAMTKATHIGLRMGVTRKQLQAKVDGLAEVEEHLTPAQGKLLEALRAHLVGMDLIQAALADLTPKGK